MSLENHLPAGTGLRDTSALADSELSYIHVKKVPRRGSIDRRTSRSPMADRLNHMSNIDITTSVTYPGYLSLSIPCTTSDDGTLVAVTPRAPSTAFQLPPLPYASPLRLHSIFTDTVATSPAQWATSHLLSLQNPTSDVELKSEYQGHTTPSPTPAATKTRVVKLPPIMHPNNPYIPWTPETRREILRPSVTCSTHVNSAAHECSSPAFHLESTSSSFGYRRSGVLSTRTKLSESLKSLTVTVSKNLRQVAKRMSRQKSPTSMVNTSEPTSFSYEVSSNSYESMDATTLTTWLSDRQRQQIEYENISSRELTLDEYEERGSWTHLSRSALTNADLFALLDGSPLPHKSRSESLPQLRPQSSSLFARSPRVASLRLNAEGTLLARDREMSMPGGWTFG